MIYSISKQFLLRFMINFLLLNIFTAICKFFKPELHHTEI